MYVPVNVAAMVRYAMLGSRGDDPTIEFAPPRRVRIAAKLRLRKAEA